MSPAEIVRFIESRRFPLNREKALQAAMADEFARNNIEARREVNLGGGDIIDFMVGDVGIEVKIKGSKLAIHRQVSRYCAHDRVVSLLLVTNVAIGLPQEINGKKVYIASLAKAWI
jgi:hypothetical protein